MKNRYFIIRCYKDLTSFTEHCDTLEQVFNACLIYSMDPDIDMLKVVDEKIDKIIIDAINN